MSSDEDIRNLLIELTNASSKEDFVVETRLFSELETLVTGKIEKEGVRPRYLELLADFASCNTLSKSLYRIAISVAKYQSEPHDGCMLSLAVLVEKTDPELCHSLLKEIDPTKLCDTSLVQFYSVCDRCRHVQENPMNNVDSGD